MTAPTFFHGPVPKPEQSRRFAGSRRLKAVLTYCFLAVGLGLVVTDVCRLAMASPVATAERVPAR